MTRTTQWLGMVLLFAGCFLFSREALRPRISTTSAEKGGETSHTLDDNTDGLAGSGSEHEGVIRTSSYKQAVSAQGGARNDGSSWAESGLAGAAGFESWLPY
jgi:hypothetical protein